MSIRRLTLRVPQPSIKPHEQAGNLCQEAVILLLLRVLFIVREGAADKVPAVCRIRQESVRSQVRSHRVHGNHSSGTDQVQVAEAQEHAPQDLRAESPFAQFHKESALDPAYRKQGQDAEQKLLFF